MDEALLGAIRAAATPIVPLVAQQPAPAAAGSQEPAAPADPATPAAPAASAAPAAVVASTPTPEQAAASARADERTRIRTILSCDAAKGRETFASHLAFSTDMSAEAAVGFLDVAPKAAAAPAAPAASASLAERMAASAIPAVAPVAPPAGNQPAAAVIDSTSIYQSRAATYRG